jgi:LDH2 family malate/lactate/ureidoglycolate dehydrogenase
MAGIKGYCISVMLELLCTVLPGADINTEMTDTTLGYFMMAIDPNIFRPLDELKSDLDKYYFSIKNSRKKEGVAEIFLPGEIEHLQAIKRKADGIPGNYVVAQEVLALAKECGRLPADAEVADLFWQETRRGA